MAAGAQLFGCAFHHHRHRSRRQQYGLRCAVSELRGELVFDAARIGQVLSGSTHNEMSTRLDQHGDIKINLAIEKLGRYPRNHAADVIVGRSPHHYPL